ncbi:DNA polymerase III subunit beta family protein [Pseudonocardia humida]|uniref:MerR family transcriptional regulator n=1 Tax=Pseudonocardia humida TaxID=2800819 RepID=A0ABT1A4J7_9PSEU|nr:MerR family transcriptional regulator [Pseudonocardia humida]MCO1657927.1 MerR family transcriptional regulator [Pseudonocardia humida]
MEESLRGIGAMARESGLSVSALRFYDGAGVLVPAVVDPRSGYRFYAPDQLVVARLVAGLRRVGMPLAGIREVLAHRDDPDALDALLAAHLRRLEQGLVDARRALSSIRSLLEEDPVPALPTTARVRGADLAAVLRAVRFAAGAHPDMPALGAVLFDVGADAITLVATDRFRLAVAPAPCVEVSGPPVGALVPVELADRIAAQLDDTEVAVSVRGMSITVGAVGGELLPDAYPDYRALLTGDGRRVAVDEGLRRALAAAPTRTMSREPDGVEFEVAALGLTADGLLTADGSGGIGVNREFLLQALDAGGPGQLELLLDGPVTPLVVRSPRSVSLLMPVRL